ncbi:MAG: hypothetical protein GWP08_03725 [Nitrospiraceae bacterium]|nr:hypothetical protein [Nitrospiraceae bacterium]
MTVTVENGGIEDYLRVGQPAAIQLEPEGGAGARLPTTVRGWELSSQIILDRPRTQGRWAPMRDGAHCIVRLVNEGHAIAFHSLIASYDNWGKSCQCRVAWPGEYHVASFRRRERMKVDISGTLSADGVSGVSVNLIDLSMSGCALIAPTSLAGDTAIQLSFSLPDGGDIRDAKATVRNSRPIGDERFVLGCEFQGGQAYLVSEIAYYTSTRLGRSSGPCVAEAAVLIIDADGTVSDPLWKALREEGCDAHIARSTLDGLVRLRTLRPPVLVVRQDQPDLSGVEIVRLVRNTPGLDTMHIFMFGGESNAADGLTAEMNLAAHFTPADSVERICDAVLEVVKAESNS